MKQRLGLYVRIVLALVVIILVSVAINFWDGKWISVFYATILALFPGEIRNVVNKLVKPQTNSRMRVTYEYLFRIMYANFSYLLVDEHHEKIYRPVGGVYKFDPLLNIATEFEGEYDGIRGVIDDTENDLRLIISSKRVKEFFDWFASSSHRETINNLTREFCEELLDTDILDATYFRGKKLTYAYVGSCREESFHEKLGIPQIQCYDIVSVQLTDEQQIALKRAARIVEGQVEPKYIFATPEDITRGYIERNGIRYDIAASARHILVKNMSHLTKNTRLTGTYSPKVD